MKKTALLYSFNTFKTAKAADKISTAFGNSLIEQINVETATEEDFTKFDNYIMGASTWFDGELPNYWDELLPALEDIDFTGKKIAVFGLGDQKLYPQNFCDALGILAEFFSKRGALLIGKWSSEGYKFETSKAFDGQNFCGLILDQENQSVQTNERIAKWVTQIKTEFGI